MALFPSTFMEADRMARVTVEDCVEKVPNRFELVLLAAQRARNLSRGEELTLDRDNDKNPVVALREIAGETLELGRLHQDLVKSLARAPEPEPADEEVLDLIPTDQNIFGLQDVSAEEEAGAMGTELSPEELEAAIEAGADDVVTGEEGYEVLTSLEALREVEKALESKLGTPSRSALVWRPQTSIAVDDEAGEKILKLVGALEDNDDVQNVYANFEVSDALVAKLNA